MAQEICRRLSNQYQPIDGLVVTKFPSRRLTGTYPLGRIVGMSDKFDNELGGDVV